MGEGKKRQKGPWGESGCEGGRAQQGPLSLGLLLRAQQASDKWLDSKERDGGEEGKGQGLGQAWPGGGGGEEAMGGTGAEGGATEAWQEGPGKGFEGSSLGSRQRSPRRPYPAAFCGFRILLRLPDLRPGGPHLRPCASLFLPAAKPFTM